MSTPSNLPTTAKTWIVANKPTSAITDDVFKVEERALGELKEGEILIRVEHLSNDPAQRTWIQKGLDPARAYGPIVSSQDSMPSGILGHVLASKSVKFAVGDLAQGFASWSTYVQASAEGFQNVKKLEGKSESLALSLLGLTGLTAWCGLFEIGKLGEEGKEGKTVVVSAAAGATGSVAVQIAKHVVGCQRVVGIAGGAEKCKHVESLGADVCVDYKSPTFKEDLERATQGGVDVYFDNVGGDILNAVLGKMNRFSRVIACGAISTYNDNEKPVNLNNWFEIISQRIVVQGFIVTDFQAKFGEAVQGLTKAIEEGKIQTEGSETVRSAEFEKIPQVWQGLFDGKGIQGKLITKLV